MTKVNTNFLTISGNLTHDPQQVKSTTTDTLCNLRLCNNDVKYDAKTQTYIDRPNYLTVVVIGGRADACLKYLKRGSYISVSGKLRSQEWADKKTGDKRSTVQIMAHFIEFLDTHPDYQKEQPQHQTPSSTPQPSVPQQQQNTSHPPVDSPMIQLSESDLQSLPSDPPVVDHQPTIDDQIPF